jgi:hypothetical protein
LVRPAGRFGGDVHTVWWCSGDVEADGELHGEPDSALISFLIWHIFFFLSGFDLMASFQGIDLPCSCCLNGVSSGF